MKTKIFNTALARNTLLAVMVASAACLPAHAARQKAVSKWTYDQLQAIDRLLDKADFRTAEEKLSEAENKVSEDYEKAVVLRAYAAVYSQQGKYLPAAEKMSAALGLNQLAADEQLQGWLQLGQLYAAAENWKKAVVAMEKWMAAGGRASSQQLIMLANCYTRLEQYSKALPHVKKAIKQAKKPEESWYRLLLGLHYELGQKSSAARVLETLISLNPGHVQYWEQLAGIHHELEQYKQAAAVGELAYRKGLFTDTDKILALISLLQYIDAPYRAAVLLEQELQKGRIPAEQKYWEQLANAWLQAREYARAAKALENAAVSQADGGLYLRLARIHIADENWQLAQKSLVSAVEKGGLDKPGDAYLLLGVAYFETGAYPESRRAFQQAGRFKEARKEARQWLAYLEAEEQTP